MGFPVGMVFPLGVFFHRRLAGIVLPKAIIGNVLSHMDWWECGSSQWEWASLDVLLEVFFLYALL